MGRGQGAPVMGEKKGALLLPAAERRGEGESAMGDCELGPEKARAMAGAEGKGAGPSAPCTQGKQQGKTSSAREGAWRGKPAEAGVALGKKGRTPWLLADPPCWLPWKTGKKETT